MPARMESSLNQINYKIEWKELWMFKYYVFTIIYDDFKLRMISIYMSEDNMKREKTPSIYLYASVFFLCFVVCLVKQM